LLAKAVCQSCMYQLIHRLREQARSHIWTVIIQVDRGEVIAGGPTSPLPQWKVFVPKKQKGDPKVAFFNSTPIRTRDQRYPGSSR